MFNLKKSQLLNYLTGLGVPFISTLLNFVLENLAGQASLLMIYLLGVFLVASRCGQSASIIASLVSALLFDFYFTQPYFSLWITDIENIIGLLVMLAVGNITSKLFDKAKKASLAKARADNEALRNALLSAISHDLQTPLTHIINAATTLMESEPPIMTKDSQEFCHIIIDQSQRMLELMHKILAMAKLNTGKINIQREWNTLEEVIGSALARLENDLSQRTININLDQNLPLIQIDSVLFEQVLLNLIENAIKYTPQTSPIDIDAFYQKPFIEIRVSDYGEGIPLPLHEKVFTKFYRIQEQSQCNGVGLGLALCKAIIQAHDGEITLETIHGKGAVFVIKLPFIPAPKMPKE